MKEKFVLNTIDTIKKERILSPLEIKKLKYGLEGFYNLFTKLVVMLILAIIFNLVKELVVLIVIYSSLRLYGFGIHAKSTLQCWLSTVPVYIGGCFFIKYATISRMVVYIIFGFGFLSFLFFAPADTASRPLIHKNKRIRAKILSLLVVIIYLLLIFLIPSNWFTNAVIYALIIESLAINPLVYKLFGASFNNYKTYQKNMV